LSCGVSRHEINGSGPVSQAIDERALAGAARAVEQEERAGTGAGMQSGAPRLALLLHGAPLAFRPGNHVLWKHVECVIGSSKVLAVIKQSPRWESRPCSIR